MYLQCVAVLVITDTHAQTLYISVSVTCICISDMTHSCMSDMTRSCMSDMTHSYISEMTHSFAQPLLTYIRKSHVTYTHAQTLQPNIKKIKLNSAPLIHVGIFRTCTRICGSWLCGVRTFVGN